MKYVVTGVAGFIGSSIADKLLEDGHEVVGIDCFIDYYPKETKLKNLEAALSNSNFKFFEDNLLKLDLEKICTGAEAIFHQAAQAGVRASWGDEFSIYTDNNILASQKILEAAKTPAVSETLKKVVYASSSSLYGNAEKLPTTEKDRPQPLSPYGVSKLAAEHLMYLYKKEFNVPTASLRYFTVYGPRQRPDMAFNRFSKSALLGEEITLYDDGEQSRDFTFIEDIVQANLNAAKYEGEELVFNIGGGSRVTVNQVLDQLKDIVGKDLNIQRYDRQKGDVKHTAADISLAAKELGYKPKVSLIDGLKAEVKWLESTLEVDK